MAHIPGFRYQAAEGPTTMVRLRLPSNGLLEIAVSTQLLEASSRLFRQHREDTMDCDDAVFDVSTAAHVTPTAIDTFLCIAAGQAFKFGAFDDTFTHFEDIVQTALFLDATDDVMRTFDTVMSTHRLLTTDWSVVNTPLDALLLLDPIRAQMPESHLACRRAIHSVAMCAEIGNGMAPFFARRDALVSLRKETLVDLMHLLFSTATNIDVFGHVRYSEARWLTKLNYAPGATDDKELALVLDIATVFERMAETNRPDCPHVTPWTSRPASLEFPDISFSLVASHDGYTKRVRLDMARNIGDPTTHFVEPRLEIDVDDGEGFMSIWFVDPVGDDPVFYPKCPACIRGSLQYMWDDGRVTTEEISEWKNRELIFGIRGKDRVRFRGSVRVVHF